MGKVLTAGSQKYSDDNWKNCDDYTRYVGAAMRHMEAYRSGEYYDEETGLPHLAHMLTNIAFLLELDKKGDLYGKD